MKAYKPNFRKRGGVVTAVFQEAVSGVIFAVAKVDEQQWLHMLATGTPSLNSGGNQRQRLVHMFIDCDGDALVCTVENAVPGIKWKWRTHQQPVFAVDEHISPVALVPVIAQNVEDNEVLMVAYTDEAGWQQTIDTKFASFYSTSRKKSWIKGETSGNKQKIEELLVSGQGDVLLYRVTQLGPEEGKPGVACHTNARTCFYRNIVVGNNPALDPYTGPGEFLLAVDASVHPNLL